MTKSASRTTALRYYDPEIGRYISADPIGLSGGLNAFGYCVNPVSWSDPLGLHDATSTYYPPDSKTGDPVTNSQLPKGTGGSPNFPSGYSSPDNHDQHCVDLANENPRPDDITRTTKSGAVQNYSAQARGYNASHSEFKIMRELAKRDDLEGSTVVIHGGQQSCQFCAPALAQFAKDNKMKIVYKSPDRKDALVIDQRPGNNSSNLANYNKNRV